jgi:hypothetical protein
MTRLVFTTEGLICEDAPRATTRVLSRVAERPDGTVRLIAEHAEHVISSFVRADCAFELHDGEGRPSGGFEPFRLRRGGRLSVDGLGLSLCSRPWSHEGWTFSPPQGPAVEATVAVAELGAGANPAGADPPAAGRALVALESCGSFSQPPALVQALALGCWLIVRWHSDPALDHVLVSPPAADAVAPGSARRAATA